MDASLFIQYCLIALAVVVSAAIVFRSQCPRTARRLRAHLTGWLLRPARPVWLQRLGRRLAPAVAAGATRCSGCDGCE